jgi:hypothetical protein
MREPARMPLPPNVSQRDLVKLSLLVCGDRTAAKDRPAAKLLPSDAR